jgi:hypothetical protein
VTALRLPGPYIPTDVSVYGLEVGQLTSSIAIDEPVI